MIMLALFALTFAAADEPAQDERVTFVIGTVQTMAEQELPDGVGFPGIWGLEALKADLPEHIAIVRASESQLAILDSFGTDDTAPFAGFAAMINSRFSEDYTAAALALAQAGTDAPSGGENMIVWVMYEYHICCCVMRADGSWESSLIMSDHNVLAGFSEAYLDQILTPVFGPMEITILK